jgi:hypothetical protein
MLWSCNLGQFSYIKDLMKIVDGSSTNVDVAVCGKNCY